MARSIVDDMHLLIVVMLFSILQHDINLKSLILKNSSVTISLVKSM